MSQPLQELTDRIWKSVTQDAYDATDIGRLIQIALNQRTSLEQLAADNERLTEALRIAGEHITKLELMEHLSHLAQYAEGSI